MSTTDQTTTNANGLPTVNRPCPPWCELKAGHGWDSGVEGVEASAATATPWAPSRTVT